jgi:hypothetical protein
VQEAPRRHPDAGLQPRPLPRLRRRPPRLRDEEEEARQCPSPPTQSIVCEICYERTALDAESIGELEKLIPAPKNSAAKTYAEPRQPYDRVERVERPGRSQFNEKPQYDRQPAREYGHSPAPVGSSSLLLSGVSSKKSCGEHPDEEILYFCFDCKC